MKTDIPDPTTEKPKRPPGRPKGLGRVPGSGRQRGTPNKRTTEVRLLLLSLKCDPIRGMARIAMNKRNPAELRGRMYSELAQYMWPKRRAIEHTGDVENPISHIERTIVYAVSQAPEQPNGVSNGVDTPADPEARPEYRPRKRL